jgi:hypothetical protein
MNKQPLALIGLALAIGGVAFVITKDKPSTQIAQNPPIEAKKTVDTNHTTTTATTTTATTSPTTSSTIAQLPVIDSTWKTYTNKSGEFSFQWPTKGRYAPKWDSSYADTDPCTDGETKMLNGNTFCHSMSAFRSDNLILTHMYTIPFGKKFIVISFSKETAQDGFDEAIFDAHLDQIMSTFTFLKK